MGRLGQFIVIVDCDGIRHAVAPFSVAAICEHADADFQAVAVALSTSPHASSP